MTIIIERFHPVPTSYNEAHRLAGTVRPLHGVASHA